MNNFSLRRQLFEQNFRIPELKDSFETKPTTSYLSECWNLIFFKYASFPSASRNWKFWSHNWRLKEKLLIWRLSMTSCKNIDDILVPELSTNPQVCCHNPCEFCSHSEIPLQSLKVSKRLLDNPETGFLHFVVVFTMAKKKFEYLRSVASIVFL